MPIRCRPRSAGLLVSGEVGWSPAWERAVCGLAAEGDAVIGIDLPTYLRGLRGRDDTYHDVVRELEQIGKQVQRKASAS